MPVVIERGPGRPRAGYRLADGTRVASVTTVLGMLAKPALLHWAWRMGCEGRDYRDHRDRAAGEGSTVHSMIDAAIHGEDPDAAISLHPITDEGRERAERLFTVFRRWEEEHRPEYLATEIPLISERHRVGGTTDLICRIDGRLTVADFKTGAKAVYPEHVLQLAAYAHLWHEARGELPAQVALVRLTDDGHGHHVYSIDAIAPAWAQFCALVEAYRHGGAVKTLVGAR